MPDEKEPIPKFAARIKAKYPEYKDIDDTLLTQKIIAKYPEYADMVDMPAISEPSKKKVGSVVFPESESETPSTTKTNEEIISLANEYGKISGRISEIEKPVYTPGGGALMPKATSRDKDKIGELEKSIADAGYDPKEVIAEFADFPVSKDANIAELLQEKKDNPLSYERHRSAFKWQVPLFNSIRQQDPDAEGIIQDIKSGQAGGGYTDKRLQTQKAIAAANKYITDEDERRKVIQQIANDKAISYGLDDEDKLNALAQDPNYLGGQGLNKYQVQALHFLEDTDPEKAKLYRERVGQRPKEMWGGEDVMRGYEYKARELESFGMELELRALQEKLTDFKNKHEKSSLSPEEGQQYLSLYNQYETVLKDVQSQKERFPAVAALDADRMYQEAMGQRSGALKRGLLGVGENVGDALNTVNDFLMSPFRSKEERLIDDLEDLGSKKFTASVQRYKTAANQLIKSDGKLNLTGGAIANTISDVGAEIISSIGIGSITGMPASKAGRIGSMFASTFATAYNDYYTEAIEKDIKNPTTYALLHTTKEALSELINNDLAVVNKFVSPKSTLAQIAQGITKKEWDDIALKGSGRFKQALDIAQRTGKAALKNTFQEDVEEVAAQLGGNLINMGIYGEDVDAMEGVGATIVNTTIGTLPFGGLGIVGELRTMNRNQKYSLYEAAQNKEKYLAQLDIDVQNGVVTEQKAEQIRAVIENASQRLNELSEKNIINQEVADNDKIEILAEAISSEEGVTKAEMKQEDIAKEVLSKAKLPGMYGELAMQDPVAVLKDISQQAQNLDSDGNVIDDGRAEASYQATEEQFGRKVVEAAIQMFPAKASPMETAAIPEGTAENVVPSTLENISSPINTETDGERKGQEEGLLTPTQPQTTQTAGGKIVPSALPPSEEVKPKDDGRPKAILNRIYESKNISDNIKRKFEGEGLKYKPQSHAQARTLAKGVIDEFGVDEAVSMAEAGRFDGDVNSMMFAEAIDRTFEAEQQATTQEEKILAAEKWSDLTIRFDEIARQKGRFISAIYDFYKKSPLGVIISERKKRDEAFTDWFKKREKPFREVFDELQKEPEFQEILKQKVAEQTKQERADNRMKRRKKIEDTFNKLKIDTNGVNSAIIPPQLWNAAVEVMKQATLAGETVANIIQAGVDHIKANYTEAWDEQAFRDTVEGNIQTIDREGKPELTTEEKKQRILDKFRKKLSGLTEEQKEEVIRKAFKKLVDAGALEYEDFKKIIASVVGLGELTPEETARLTGFINDMNAVQDLSDAVIRDQSKEALEAFEKGVKKAEKSATQLAGMLYNKPNVGQRLRSIIQLNTLGIVSLIKNPFYNIFHQLFVRLPKGLFMTAFDQVLLGASKLTNKLWGNPVIKPDTNVALGQLGYFKKGMQGAKEAIKQVFTGLTNKDYFQKEVYNSQIKPFTSIKDLWNWGRGKKELTKGQIADKFIQALPNMGMSAEIVARLLNIGDKPFRYAAEAAIAETIGKQEFGLKGLQLEIFMRLPKEQAKSLYLKKGLTEEQASKRAENIEKRIITEGEEAVFQQENVISEMFNKLKQALPKDEESHPLSSFASEAGRLVGLLNIPFVKTPVNVAWEVFNLVNPEFALFQSFVYGIRGAKTGSRQDFLKAKKWMAHAATGWALLGVAGYLASIGAVSGDDEDEAYKAKEAKGKETYGKGHNVNMSKIMRAMNGGSIETEDGDINVDLSWFGAMGMIMNMQANKYENMTKEEREDLGYIDELLYRLERGSQDALVNSIFEGALNGVAALTSNKYDQWLLGMTNVGINAFEPATVAQISRATRPEEYKIKGDDLSDTMTNSLKSRFFGDVPPRTNIWGEEMKREGSIKDVAFRMLGIHETDTDKFALPLFKDFKRTGNANFFPPYVMPNLNIDGENIKLTSEQRLQFEALVGQARKTLVAPFVNDMATMKSGKKKLKYSKMDDEQKIETLKKIYKQGYNEGKKLFIQLHPELK